MTMSREQAFALLRGEVKRHVPDADDDEVEKVIRKAASFPRTVDPREALARASASIGRASTDGFFGIFPTKQNGLTEPKVVTYDRGDRNDDILCAMRCAGMTPEVVALFGGDDALVEDVLARTVVEARRGTRGN
jgi:hypothetical protein